MPFLVRFKKKTNQRKIESNLFKNFYPTRVDETQISTVFELEALESHSKRKTKKNNLLKDCYPALLNEHNAISIVLELEALWPDSVILWFLRSYARQQK